MASEEEGPDTKISYVTLNALRVVGSTTETSLTRQARVASPCPQTTPAFVASADLKPFATDDVHCDGDTPLRVKVALSRIKG